MLPSPPLPSRPRRHADYKAGSAPDEDAFFEDADTFDYGDRPVAGAIKAMPAAKDGASSYTSCSVCCAERSRRPFPCMLI